MSFVTLPNSRDNIHVDRTTLNVSIGLDGDDGPLTHTLNIRGSDGTGSVGLIGARRYSLTSTTDNKLLIEDEGTDRLFINENGDLFQLNDTYIHNKLSVGRSDLVSNTINYDLEITNTTPNIGLVDSNGTTSVIQCEGNNFTISNSTGGVGLTILNNPSDVWVNNDLIVGNNDGVSGLVLSHSTNGQINNTTGDLTINSTGSIFLNSTSGGNEVTISNGLTKIPSLQLNDANTVTNITIDPLIQNLTNDSGTLITETVVKALYDKLKELIDAFNGHLHGYTDSIYGGGNQNKTTGAPENPADAPIGNLDYDSV